MSNNSISLALTSCSQSSGIVSSKDEEYFLVEKLNEVRKRTKVNEQSKVDLKDVKERSTLRITPGGGVARSVGLFKTKLVCDIEITPSTSSALSTSVALAPSTDTNFTNHYQYLFSEIKIDSARLELDFHQFSNLTGDSGVVPVMVWGYTPKSFSTVQTYSLVSDYATSRPVRWSPASPNVSYNVPAKWLRGSGWTNGQEGVSAAAYFNEWTPCDFAATQPFCRGYVNIASQAATGTSGSRQIIGRMILNVTFRNKI